MNLLFKSTHLSHHYTFGQLTQDFLSPEPIVQGHDYQYLVLLVFHDWNMLFFPDHLTADSDWFRRTSNCDLRPRRYAALFSHVFKAICMRASHAGERSACAEGSHTSKVSVCTLNFSVLGEPAVNLCAAHLCLQRFCMRPHKPSAKSRAIQWFLL